jgi:predicted transposase/invertase (TIGR01784 family)
MRFINPKTDFAFKKIFGSEGSETILRSFLNAMLYEGRPKIASLQIVDPYSIPRLEGMKDTYVDVRAVLEDGQHVIIEMQVLNVPGMEKRVLYNAAKEYSQQLLKGHDYDLLNPVVALTITDFVMFPELEDQIISRFILMEKNKLVAYPEGDVELVFVELAKFKRSLEQLQSATDEWLFFVDQAAELSSVPPKLKSVPEIETAFERAEAAKLTPDEDLAMEQKTRWIADQKAILAAKLRSEEQLVDVAAKLEQAEAKAEQAEAKAEQAETKAKLAEAEAAQANSKVTALQETALTALLAAGIPLAQARRSLGLD